MFTPEQLFSTPAEYSPFEAMLLEALERQPIPGQGVPRTRQRAIFDLMPQYLQSEAFMNGLADAGVLDEMLRFIRMNPAKFTLITVDLYGEL